MGLGDPFDNTPPVAKALAGSAFDNSAPVSKAVAQGAFDNTAPGAAVLTDSAFSDAPPGNAIVRTVPTFTAKVVIFGSTGGTVWAGDFYDNVQVEMGDTVLLVGEIEAEDNGLYLIQPSLTRLPGADSSASLSGGLRVHILEGEEGAGRVYLLTTPPPIIVGDSPLVFSEITAYPRPL